MVSLRGIITPTLLLLDLGTAAARRNNSSRKNTPYRAFRKRLKRASALAEDTLDGPSTIADAAASSSSSGHGIDSPLNYSGQQDALVPAEYLSEVRALSLSLATYAPSTSQATYAPSANTADTAAPTEQPTANPTTDIPTKGPTTKPTTDDSQLRDVTSQQYDAVIVGAGWAGIRAAKTLLDEGITNILVLEANDYIGGRSKTINTDGSINTPNPSNVSNALLDVGAEWLYINSGGMEDYLKDNGYLDGIDLNDGQDSFTPMRDSLFYMQSVSDDGTLEAERMDDSVLWYLYDAVWGGFLSFRNELLWKEDDQSYFSE